MKRFFASLAAIGSLCCITPNVWGRPVDLSAPSNGVGSANLRGYLEIWTEVDSIDFGKDFKLPLRFKFSSEPSVRGQLGEGFWLPITEASAVLIRPRMMKVSLLCGKTLYLVRDRKDKSKFQSSNLQWNGTLDGDEFAVSRDDGWELKFNKGRLSSLRTDTGRQLKWIYSGASKVLISENGNNALIIENTQREGEIMMTVNGRRHFITKGKRPVVITAAGQRAIEGFQDSLSKWHWSDGRVAVFEFSTTEGLIPKLVTNNSENVQSNDTYTWDPVSGYIRSENDWIYEVTKSPEKFGAPSVYRTNAIGEREGMSVDVALGIYKRLQPTGELLTTYTSKENGPARDKVLRQVKKIGDEEIVLLRSSYDQLGRLISKIDENGFITKFEYGSDGVLLKKSKESPTDPKILEALEKREQELLKIVNDSSDTNERDQRLLELALFYIHSRGENQKAIDLISAISDPNLMFIIRFNSISYDLKATQTEKVKSLSELASDFPEKKLFLMKF